MLAFTHLLRPDPLCEKAGRSALGGPPVLGGMAHAPVAWVRVL